MALRFMVAIGLVLVCSGWISADSECECGSICDNYEVLAWSSVLGEFCGQEFCPEWIEYDNEYDCVTYNNVKSVCYFLVPCVTPARVIRYYDCDENGDCTEWHFEWDSTHTVCPCTSTIDEPCQTPGAPSSAGNCP